MGLERLEEIERQLSVAEDELSYVQTQRQFLLDQIASLMRKKEILLHSTIEERPPQYSHGTVSNRSSEEAKIAVFRSLFHGRDDVYARRFESRTTGKSGYQPDCKNEVVVLGSSIQLLSPEHPYDHWGNYPKARKRILDLLAESKPKLTVILSGDRHLGEISRSDDSGLPYPLYDITSSGLTHHVGLVYHLRCLFSPEINRYRVGTQFYEKNFGLVDVDWSGPSPVLSLQVRDQENRPQRQVSVSTAGDPAHDAR